MLGTVRSGYLTFSGRLPRRAYWVRSAVAALATGLLAAVAGFAAPLGLAVFLLFALAACLVGGLASVSLAVRRFQDLGRNGWIGVGALWASGLMAYSADYGLAPPTAALLAGVVSLALFVYLGFVRGSRGPNAYGPDPLA